ncbi:MAG: hypothetical protein H6977_06265 [Gammaproteobacteria bacterium]|nr:hypothetical protein [Gammaproteobacteria bacterium]MCP5199595.1 hypothetical protein [Gammaproteobacteria bacterium]
MIRTSLAAACGVLLTALATTPAVATPAPTRIAPDALAARVAVAPWYVDQGRINGMIQNRSDRTVLEVVVLVRYGWLWARPELADGDEPGWAEYVTLDEPIAPGDSLPFVYAPGRPLPVRDDGHFVPSVEIVSATLQPPPAS